MSPRNQDNPNYKSIHFPGESDDCLDVDFTPKILHKKHKVIKLVKAQLLNLQEDGLLDSTNSTAAGNAYSLRRGADISVDFSNDEETEERIARMAAHPDYAASRSASSTNETMSPFVWIVWLILFLTTLFIMLLLVAWLSVGPLSNRAPHTPIHWSSLVKTERICDLEKKYLLRWSTSNHLE